jgi:hypothetical protein
MDSKSELDSAASLFLIFHQVVAVIQDLQAGCTDIYRVVGYERQIEFKDFVDFLQCLEVYGTGYNDDIDARNYKIRETVTHKESTVKKLQ